MALLPAKSSSSQDSALPTTGPGTPVATYITVPKSSLAAREQGGVVCVLEGGRSLGSCRKALGLSENGQVIRHIVNSSVCLW